MQNKQNTGVDTFGMLPVLAAIFLAGVQLLAPWVSISALKYTQMSTRYSLWQLETGLEQFQKSVGMSGTKLAGAGMTEAEFHRIAGDCRMGRWCTVLGSSNHCAYAFGCGCSVSISWKKCNICTNQFSDCNGAPSTDIWRGVSGESAD